MRVASTVRKSIHAKAVQPDLALFSSQSCNTCMNYNFHRFSALAILPASQSAFSWHRPACPTASLLKRSRCDMATRAQDSAEAPR